jgi:hypothetical protein
MVIFLIAVAVAMSLVTGVQWRAAATPISASLSFDDSAFTGATGVFEELGGPLTAAEIDVIRRISRQEVEKAFAGLHIQLTSAPQAFWRVRVVPSVDARSFNGRRRINAAGASWGFGPLGGGAFVNFNTLALNAVRYAPPGTARASVVEAIGRGIGRSAVHEFAHMIAAGVQIDSTVDRDSYEYRTADRASQYYGELRWTTAWPVLQKKVGR